MTNPVRSRRRSIRLVAAAAVVGVVSTSIVAAGGGSANAADKQLSHSTGRFLSGSFAGTSFDTIAGIEGESASFPADPGANKNSLNAELLNGALKLPLSDGLQLPGLGAIQLGAVAQYAKANSNGSALGASGAVDSNGGIGVGGSDGVPTGGASVDLSGLPGASAVTSVIGNVKLGIGAVSSRSQQVALGKKIADPSAGCLNGPYSRVSDPDQAGTYNIAGLTLEAKSPLLSTLGTTLIGGLGTLLTTLNTTLKALPGGLVVIDGLPTAADLTKDLSLDLADGSIVVSLADGSLKVDLAKLLTFLGFDLNNLCPNTNLLGYVADALTKLPAAIVKLVGEITTKLTDSLGKVTVTVAGLPLSASILTGIINPLVKTLTDGLSTALSTVNTSALQPLIDILTSSLLKIVANQQSETDGVFSETALQLNVLPGGAALPALPSLPSVPAALTKSAATKAMAPGVVKAKAAIKKAESSKSTSNFAGGFTFLTKLDRPVLAAAAARPLSAPVALKAAGDPALQLNLANSTVGPNAAAAPPSTVVPTTTVPTSNVPSTIIPTGVPAGAAGHGDGGLPVLPLIALLMLLSVAGGSYWQLRLRGNGSH